MNLQQQRNIGIAIAIIEVITLVIAFLIQPFGEWGTMGMFFGLLALLFFFIGLLAVVSKNPTLLTGRRTRESSRKWSRFGLIIIVIAVILMIIAGFVGGWNATAVLQVGIFAGLLAMFGGGYLASRNA